MSRKKGGILLLVLVRYFTGFLGFIPLAPHHHHVAEILVLNFPRHYSMSLSTFLLQHVFLAVIQRDRCSYVGTRYNTAIDNYDPVK